MYNAMSNYAYNTYLMSLEKQTKHQIIHTLKKQNLNICKKKKNEYENQLVYLSKKLDTIYSEQKP